MTWSTSISMVADKTKHLLDTMAGCLCTSPWSIGLLVQRAFQLLLVLLVLLVLLASWTNGVRWKTRHFTPSGWATASSVVLSHDVHLPWIHLVLWWARNHPGSDGAHYPLGCVLIIMPRRRQMSSERSFRDDAVGLKCRGPVWWPLRDRVPLNSVQLCSSVRLTP